MRAATIRERLLFLSQSSMCGYYLRTATDQGAASIWKKYSCLFFLLILYIIMSIPFHFINYMSHSVSLTFLYKVHTLNMYQIDHASWNGNVNGARQFGNLLNTIKPSGLSNSCSTSLTANLNNKRTGRSEVHMCWHRNIYCSCALALCIHVKCHACSQTLTPTMKHITLV